MRSGVRRRMDGSYPCGRFSFIEPFIHGEFSLVERILEWNWGTLYPRPLEVPTKSRGGFATSSPGVSWAALKSIGAIPSGRHFGR